MKRIRLAALPLAMIVTGCRHKPNTAETAPNNVATAPVPARAATPVAAPAPPDFSIDNVPISNAPLGKFPFFGLPPKYIPQNTPKPPQFGHFLFWTGKAFRDVEGQTYMVTIITAASGDFSSYGLQRNMHALFTQAGAVKISDAKIPSQVIDAIPDATRQDLGMGLGDVWNDPVETWVIHRPTDAVWIHYTTNSAEASLAVVETQAFVPTATMLPADRLKSDLDKTGKAVIHVNFVTDQSQVLPTSAAQMNAVVALLKADPALKLAINGYTDDTGSDDHNLTLSDARAKAVQASLVAAGIAADRLQAKGYGRANPVSTNTDEEAKAANRRVELIKL
ncbi:OmpA family protein [Sphingomonas bacterium]|uniref:OmpA family protein n=1 Tax=Sphingomonas bacterium TaxID=1895847 RepID=UPI0020C708D4|nr:OmpA family protein [Sphingomonas bacterium]